MTDKTELDALVDVTGFRGTPEQLMNALSEMVRREPRQMQGAILRAALSALTATNARADAAEAERAKAEADALRRAADSLLEASVWCESQDRPCTNWHNGVVDARKDHIARILALIPKDGA
jgi:hypothetical protein